MFQPIKRTFMLSLAALVLCMQLQSAYALPDDAVNINKAQAEELAAVLDGVGAARAQAIVDYREQYGEFASVDELLEVRGIGAAVLEANRAKITLSD